MSKVRAEEYTDKSGTGAPNFSKGIVVSAGSSAGIGSTFPDRTLHVAQANSTAYSSTDFDQNYHVLKLQNFTDDKSVGLQFKIGTTEFHFYTKVSSWKFFDHFEKFLFQES